MGKGTDKLYITHSEWSNKFSEGGINFGGKKEGSSRGKKILPFKCCYLTQIPFKSPVCTEEGHIFEYESILQFLKQYKINPVSGAKLKSKDLMKITVYRNENDELMCPISEKPFNESTRIVLNRKSGHVYSYSTIEELNIKARNMRDLVTDEEFKKTDLIDLYDPKDLDGRIINNFYYVKNNIRFNTSQKPINEEDVSNVNPNSSVKRILDLVKEETKEEKKQKLDLYLEKPETKENKSVNQKSNSKAHNASLYTTGHVAASLTSTTFAPVTVNENILLSNLEYMLPKIKSNSFVKLKTNFGDLEFELYCSFTPQTCYNFITLAKNGIYDNLRFANSIKNLILISEDPEEKIKSFYSNSDKEKDVSDYRNNKKVWSEELVGKESMDRLNSERAKKQSHDKRGLLSMIIDPKTNYSHQFFITFRPATQFDKKHIIFGRLVGNLSTLDKIEAVPAVDFIPTENIFIEKVIVLSDPFQEFSERLERKLEYLKDNKNGSGKNKGTDIHNTKLSANSTANTTNWFGQRI
ncbi:hypothetical protein BB559_004450 [Furculomyces boomerangus]|uniref:PPIase cyclophilin-type domain-containing protein n=2 Tax=Harpellales TaxID=61421 RepID=A0A2T9YEM8_9FUNG|nr:hypothetical protein BB559_004450 [Furculomyces boomerangus]PWA02712.1 hypothetical protein BB558_001142 [Smittium angustum]